MSAPIAGRRKGQASAPHESLFSAPAGDPGAVESEPSWLAGPSTTTTAAAPPPSQTTRYFHGSPAQNAQTDPLDFLNFDNDVPPVAAPAAVPVSAPHVTAQQPAPSSSSPLDFLDFDDAPRAAVALPSEQPPPHQATLFSTGADPFSRPVNDALVREYERLFSQFTQLESELAQSSAVVAAIDGGSHDVIREYEAAEFERKQLGDKIVEAEQSLRDAESARDTRQQADTAAADTTIQAHRNDAATAVRKEWTERLEATQAKVQSQRASLESTRREYEAMQSDVVSASVTDGAVRTLESRLGGLVRTLRADFGLMVKPLLSRCIQAEMAEAGQQRADIARSDAKTRREALQTFTEARMQAFTAFVNERSNRHLDASDKLFGALKRDMEDFRTTRTAVRARDLREFHAALAAGYETARDAIRDQIHHQVQMDERTCAQEADGYTSQERQLAERLSQQRRLLRERTEAERTQLVKAMTPDTKVVLPRGGDGAQSVLDRQWQASLALVAQHARQLHLDVRTRREMAHASAQRRSSSSSVDHNALKAAHEQLRSRKHALEEAFLQSGASLERWRSAVAPLSDTVARMGSRLQEGRVRLAGLHAAVRETRRVWEHDVRQVLNRTLTPPYTANNQDVVTWPSELLTDVLHDLTGRLDQHRQLERALRQGRHDFVDTHNAQMDQLKRAYAASTDRLEAVFTSFDHVTRTGAQLEAHRLALEAAAEDMESAQAALEKDQEAVAELQSRVERQAQRLEERSALLEVRSCPLQDVTPHHVNNQHKVSRQARGAPACTGELPSPLTPAPYSSSVPPTPVRKGDVSGTDGAPWGNVPLSRSPAHRQAGPRRYGLHDAPPTTSTSDASPHSVWQSSTTLATDFSTSLVGFDDDDEDVTATDDAVVVGAAGDSMLYQRFVPSARPRPTRESPSVDAVPQVEQTNLGRSLTTPSASE